MVELASRFLSAFRAIRKPRGSSSSPQWSRCAVAHCLKYMPAKVDLAGGQFGIGTVQEPLDLSMSIFRQCCAEAMPTSRNRERYLRLICSD